MKNLGLAFFVAAMTAVSTLAAASPSHRFNALTDLSHDARIEHYEYGFNADVGRAWVEVAYREPYFDEYPAGRLRVAIEGLAYDKQTQTIVLQDAGVETVCATLRQRGWGFFQQPAITPTGACRLSLTQQTVTRDDGFDVWTAPHWALTLELTRPL